MKADEGEVEAMSWLYLDAQEDNDYQKLLGAHLRGTSVRNLPPDHPAHCYEGVWDQLSTRDDPDGRLLLVLDGARIVVPRRARKRILELLHRPHAGVVKTQQAASQLYYWPGMSAALSDAVEKCELCAAALPSMPLASVLAPTTAARPMQAVGFELFHAGGCDYLVMVLWLPVCAVPLVHHGRRGDAGVGRVVGAFWLPFRHQGGRWTPVSLPRVPGVLQREGHRAGNLQSVQPEVQRVGGGRRQELQETPSQVHFWRGKLRRRPA